MKHILGFSAGFHDAAISVVREDGEILFAAHSERYSKVKNDPNIHHQLVKEAFQYPITEIAYYERPWMKQLARFRSGQKIDWSAVTLKQVCDAQLGKRNLPMSAFPHHISHAAAAFQTSEFAEAAVVIIDAIGEFDTVSIFKAEYNIHGRACYKKLWSQKYPHSIGLFYSAVTQQLGLKPMDEEYITMGMAAWGTGELDSWMQKTYVEDPYKIIFKDNFHIGIDVKEKLSPVEFDETTIAHAAQSCVELLIEMVMFRARRLTHCKNLIFSGGVALNCVANSALGEYFDNIWIMPNPGDAGSSLGAAALALGSRLKWRNAYLGHEISGAYPTNRLLDSLLSDGIVGVASGRCEFGPRALGNRSLLADPRGADIKDRVNEIKRRQKFRPFAPVILEEHADQYFVMPRGWDCSRYMQSTAQCRHPDLFPAICHVDGSSRVQTVPRDGSGIRELLEKWYVVTGCPMLLNTSLNIRGEPMVNDQADAQRFQDRYGVRVWS